MAMQSSLFPGAFLDETAMETLVSPLHVELFRVVQDPFDDLLEYRRTDPNFRILTEGESAQWLRPQIVERARRLLRRDDVRFRVHNNQFQIIFQEKVAIVPKKLKLGGRYRTRLTFSSYPTTQNVSYWGQRQTDGFEDLPRVLLGYLPQKEMTEIKIMVAYPCVKYVRFCYLIPDQTAAILAIREEREDLTEAEAVSRGFKVKPKKHARKQR